MRFLSSTDMFVGALVVLIGAVACLFLSRKLHKFITGGSSRDDKPRWFAANGAGIAFFLAGLTKLPDILFRVAGLVSGDDREIGPILANIAVLTSVTAIGAAVGFLVGKVKS